MTVRTDVSSDGPALQRRSAVGLLGDECAVGQAGAALEASRTEPDWSTPYALPAPARVRMRTAQGDPGERPDRAPRAAEEHIDGQARHEVPAERRSRGDGTRRRVHSPPGRELRCLLPSHPRRNAAGTETRPGVRNGYQWKSAPGTRA